MKRNVRLEIQIKLPSLPTWFKHEEYGEADRKEAIAQVKKLNESDHFQGVASLGEYRLVEITETISCKVIKV